VCMCVCVYVCAFIATLHVRADVCVHHTLSYISSSFLYHVHYTLHTTEIHATYNESPARTHKKNIISRENGWNERFYVEKQHMRLLGYEKCVCECVCVWEVQCSVCVCVGINICSHSLALTHLRTQAQKFHATPREEREARAPRGKE
jgi:hypothetical protein